MVHYPPSGDVLGLDDKLLTIILGALLAGAGMAVCFTAGGATGGSDAPCGQHRFCQHRATCMAHIDTKALHETVDLL